MLQAGICIGNDGGIFQTFVLVMFFMILFVLVGLALMILVVLVGLAYKAHQLLGELKNATWIMDEVWRHRTLYQPRSVPKWPKQKETDPDELGQKDAVAEQHSEKDAAAQ